MIFSKENASLAYSEINKAELIDSSVKTSWQNTLWYPGPPGIMEPNATAPNPASIAGLAHNVIQTIAGFRILEDFSTYSAYKDAIQAYFESMDDVGLDQIFGGG